jgi:hypothetical protein
MIAKIFEKEVNNLLKKPYERQPKKKTPHVNGTVISNFFVAKDFYKKDDVQQKQFWEDLVLLIVKNHLPMLKELVCIHVSRFFHFLKNSFQDKFCKRVWKKKTIVCFTYFGTIICPTCFDTSSFDF